MKVSSSSATTSVRSSLLLAILTMALYFAPAYGDSCSCDPCIAKEGTYCDGFGPACSECCGGSYWGDASGNPCDDWFCIVKYCKKGNPFHCCGSSTVARPRPESTPPPTGAPSTGEPTCYSKGTFCNIGFGISEPGPNPDFSCEDCCMDSCGYKYHLEEGTKLGLCGCRETRRLRGGGDDA